MVAEHRCPLCGDTHPALLIADPPASETATAAGRTGGEAMSERHDFIPGPGLFDTPPVCACGADVDDDIHDDLPAEDRDRRLEADERVAALREDADKP